MKVKGEEMKNTLLIESSLVSSGTVFFGPMFTDHSENAQKGS